MPQPRTFELINWCRMCVGQIVSTSPNEQGDGKLSYTDIYILSVKTSYQSDVPPLQNPQASTFDVRPLTILISSQSSSFYYLCPRNPPVPVGRPANNSSSWFLIGQVSSTRKLRKRSITFGQEFSNYGISAGRSALPPLPLAKSTDPSKLRGSCCRRRRMGYVSVFIPCSSS